MDNQRYYGSGVRQYSAPAIEKEVKQAKTEDARQELINAIRGSNDILATAQTALAVFPDTVTIDRAKLTVTKRAFFSTAEVMSIRVEDILNVTATFGPIFGSIKIVSRVMNQDKPYYLISRLWREDAQRLKHIIQGYVIALQNEIDTKSLSTLELSVLLDNLGEDNHTTQ